MDVGVEHFFIEDSSRSSVTSYRSRTIPISVFYPATRRAESPQVRYVDVYRPAIQSALKYLLRKASLSERDEATIIEGSSRIGTGCYEGARLLAECQPYPLLIYSPTGDGNRFSNVPVIKRIVASGYVVISIDHPHEGSLVVHPDGRICSEVADNDDFIEITKERVKDAGKVLNFVVGTDMPKALSETLDLDAVGMFGHSRGGYVSTLFDAEDDRIKAVGNIDGFLYAYWTQDGTTGIDRWPQRTRRKLRESTSPFLRIRRQLSTGNSGDLLNAEGRDINGDFTYVIFEGWEHEEFSTSRIQLNKKNLERTKTLFSFQPEERVEELGSVITEFFDIYLKRKACRKLLAIDNRPSVQFRKKRCEPDEAGDA